MKRRFVRLVVGRHRPVFEPLGCEQPAPAVGLHDERVVAADGGLGPCIVGRLVARWVVLLDGPAVEAGPLALLRVPPDVSLPLRPRLAVWIGRGAVVEGTAGRRPRPPPPARDGGLL